MVVTFACAVIGTTGNPDSKPDVNSARGSVPWIRFGRRLLPAWICDFSLCSVLCILRGSSCLSWLLSDRSSRRLMLTFVVPCPPPLRSSCPLPTAQAARSRPRNCPVTRLTRSPAPWHASCAPEGNAVTLFNDVTPSVPRIRTQPAAPRGAPEAQASWPKSACQVPPKVVAKEALKGIRRDEMGGLTGRYRLQARANDRSRTAGRETLKPPHAVLAATPGPDALEVGAGARYRRAAPIAVR